MGYLGINLYRIYVRLMNRTKVSKSSWQSVLNNMKGNSTRKL